MVDTTSGTKFFVSLAHPATYDAAGFGALTYTQIKGIRQVGEIGRKYQTVETNSLDAVVQYRKPAGRAALSIDIEVLRINDPGQAILYGAVGAALSYSYRLLSPDGTSMYFTAFLSSWMRGGFSASSFADQRGTLEVVSEVVQT